MMRSFLSCLAAILILFSYSNAQSWIPMPGSNGPINAIVSAAPVENPYLFAGGSFDTIGGIAAANFAYYDGRRWNAAGAGVDGPVRAITELNGTVWVGGDFLSAGGNTSQHIAQWNGLGWTALNTPLNGTVYAIAIYHGALYIGGNFSINDSVQGVARWTGSQWASLGGGVDNAVYALTVFNDELIAGGDFSQAGGVTANRLARWNGTNWQPVGTDGGAGVLGTVSALGAYNTTLVVGGVFNEVDGQLVNNLASWNGSAWSSMQGGTDGPVMGISVQNGSLYLLGGFTNAGGVFAPRIAVWNGSGWGTLQGGAYGDGAMAISSFGTDLYIGGSLSYAGGARIANIAHWSTSSPPSGTITVRKIWDVDGDRSTTGDQTPKSWGLQLYRGIVAPQTLIASVNAESFSFGYPAKGTYIAVEADSGFEWSRIGKTSLFDTLSVTSDSSVQDTFYNVKAVRTLVVDLQQGWNLLSVPLEIGSYAPADYFRRATSQAFEYRPGTGYVVTDSMPVTRGVWMKYTDSDTARITGYQVSAASAAVKKGWNLIGGISSAVPVSALIQHPAGILISLFYGFEGGYIQANSLLPGHSYWVKSAADGTLDMVAPAGEAGR